jgi:hypothetical protein
MFSRIILSINSIAAGCVVADEQFLKMGHVVDADIQQRQVACKSETLLEDGVPTNRGFVSQVEDKMK